MMNEISATLARGDCFKLLAACFYEPDKQLFLEEKLTVKLEHLFTDLAPDGVPSVRHMHEALKEQHQESLSVEHAALFVGPFELIAAPYGSVYLENRRAVMGDSTVTAAQMYQKAGLSVDVKEPADHIAIELEFMYYLCTKQGAALLDQNLSDAAYFKEFQTDFFLGSLRPWVTLFCDAVLQGTENKFYVNLADSLARFMHSCDLIYYTSSARQGTIEE